jgi:FGGY-family pentulose kinase
MRAPSSLSRAQRVLFAALALASASGLTLPTPRFAIGVDVGTGSARAGLVDTMDGRLVAVQKQDIKTWTPRPEYYEQSSEDIWDACLSCVRGVLKGIDPASVCGVGFDATCSLVCLDDKNSPVGIDPTAPDEAERNIVMWCDHRATAQAEAINRGGHERLRTVGGAISPEMEVPKLLWLREELPEAFRRVATGGGKVLDLADFLAYRATDHANDVRSLCTVVCKWNYDANDGGTGKGWDRSFLESVGFAAGELEAEVVGAEVAAPGSRVAGGLGAEAAAAMGLKPGTALAVGMIDAHAGGVGCLGAALPPMDPSFGSFLSVPLASPGPLPSEEEQLDGRLGLIAGTSTCHMASSTAPVFVPGVWGPYWNAMAPGLYLNEGGQSAAGSLIDHVVRTHPAHPELKAMAGICGVSETAALNLHLEVLRAKAGYADVAELGAAIHVGPDFLGNRSPLADHEMRGSLVGLRMATNTSLDDLATLYLGAVQSLAYQTRHIVETMQAAGHCPITSVVACGGLSKNKLYTATHANVLGLPVHLPEQEEAVLLGAAILGATAGGAHGSVNSAMRAMSKIGETVKPRTEASAFHERKYAVFRRMSDDQLEYRRLMGGPPPPKPAPLRSHDPRAPDRAPIHERSI